jgi:hypothetical protein
LRLCLYCDVRWKVLAYLPYTAARHGGFAVSLCAQGSCIPGTTRISANPSSRVGGSNAACTLRIACSGTLSSTGRAALRAMQTSSAVSNQTATAMPACSRTSCRIGAHSMRLTRMASKMMSAGLHAAWSRAQELFPAPWGPMSAQAGALDYKSSAHRDSSNLAVLIVVAASMEQHVGSQRDLSMRSGSVRGVR